MDSNAPQENFPAIGTVENPALFFNERDLFLSYDIAPTSGGGVAVIKFSDVIHFEKNPVNVEGLGDAKYPTRAWEFTEVYNSDPTMKWKVLRPRFWTISFNDVTVEIVFSNVQKVHETRQVSRPFNALLGFLGA